MKLHIELEAQDLNDLVRKLTIPTQVAIAPSQPQHPITIDESQIRAIVKVRFGMAGPVTGHIHIPAKILTRLDWKKGDLLELILVGENTLVIRRP